MALLLPPRVPGRVVHRGRVAGIHPECKIFQQVVKEEALCLEKNESVSSDFKGFLQRNCTQKAYWSEPFPPYAVACGFDEGSSKGPEDQKSYYSAFWRVYTAGYAASVTSLITALIVFAAFRKFHCTRNYIHMHLFVSFILRAIAVFTKDAVLFADETMDHCLMSTINFIIFINVIRILVHKLKSQDGGGSHSSHFVRLAKSTLLLIPLFGVHYIVFAFFPESTGLEARLYIELGLGSFQGFVVALLYCFSNAEVQSELKKQLCKWQYQEYLSFTHKHGTMSRENSPVNYVTQLSLLEKISPKRKTSAYQNGVTSV
ncbi:Vasoactive intestinal polypeptide receptor 1-like protein [Aix galericulata]|nr:Vasoactive intestinal polypeptide receptor 1-like protein [Aix galericulata]